MAEVLSQFEIEALLRAVSSGQVDTDAKTSPEWNAYDLTSQERIVRGRLVALQGIHERFSRLFQSSLSGVLKKNTRVSVSSIEFCPLQDYVKRVPALSSVHLMQMQNLNGQMAFVVGTKLAYALIGAYYGGSERPFANMNVKEKFTAIENTMLKNVCGLAVKDMEAAWKPNYPLELVYARAVSTPSPVVLHESEPIAVVSIHVELEHGSGNLVVVIPLGTLDPIQQLLSVNVIGDSSNAKNEKEEWERHWLTELADVELNVRVRMGCEVSLLEVRRFRRGQWLPLNENLMTPWTVHVEGVPKLKGSMEISHGHSSIRITDFTRGE